MFAKMHSSSNFASGNTVLKACLNIQLLLVPVFMELANPVYKTCIVHAGAPETSFVWAYFALTNSLLWIFQAAAQYLLQIPETGMDLL